MTFHFLLFIYYSHIHVLENAALIGGHYPLVHD